MVPGVAVSQRMSVAAACGGVWGVRMDVACMSVSGMTGFRRISTARSFSTGECGVSLVKSCNRFSAKRNWTVLGIGVTGSTIAWGGGG